VGATPAVSVERFTGGEPFADVIDEPGGLLPYPKKHLGELKFAEVEAQIGVDAHPALYRWIRDAWLGEPVREKVALDTQEAGTAPPHTIELAHARIHQVVLPALDSVSRDRRFITLRIAPRAVRKTSRAEPPSLDREEREFLSHNFSVTIAGIDCSGVLSIDSLTVQTQLPEDGGVKKPTLIFPDIHLHVEADKAEPFRQWFEEFVIQGNNDDDQERDGAITYLDSMLSDPLAVLQLRHLGIYRVAEEPPVEKGPRRVRVDLYCERMELRENDIPSGNTVEELSPLNL
jgi:hypothetical protein